MQAICNGTKHFLTDDRLILSTGRGRQLSVAGIDISDFAGPLVVRRSDGGESAFVDILETVLEFWSARFRHMISTNVSRPVRRAASGRPLPPRRR